MQSGKLIRTVAVSLLASTIVTGGAIAGTFVIDTQSLSATTASAELAAQNIHYLRRHHPHRRGVIVAPNASVTVEGNNGLATASRSVTGNGDGTWSAERHRSVTNNNTGVTCQRNGTFDSGSGQGTISRSCSD